MHARIAARIDTIETLMEQRLYLHGSLARKVRAARGRLPRVALATARELVEARRLLANPATARHLDPNRVETSCNLLERHLSAIPEGKYRRRMWSAVAGLAAMRLLAVLILLLVVLRWRGFL